MSPLPRTTLVTTAAELAQCLAVRRDVFVVEQGVSEAEEWDGLDEVCQHFLSLAPEPVGTARLRVLADGTAKAQRVAVLAAWRGRGVGAALMAVLEAHAAELGCTEVVLSAQLQALRFYQRLGYLPEGDVYDEANIPHRRMRKQLRQRL